MKFLYGKLPLLLLASTLLSQFASAKPSQMSEWIVEGPDEDNNATIYLSREFTRVTGVFPNIPASSSDTRESLSGTFIVGQYKYIFHKPTFAGSGVLADEVITTNILVISKCWSN
jgi:hypothetical protein